MTLTRLCFVCSGNICRSPLAEAIFKQQVEEAGRSEQFHVESFGIGPWHIGEPPDPRAQQTARRHGLHLPGRARQFKPHDFERFDQVWALDSDVADFLRRLAPTAAARAKVRLLREHDPDAASATGDELDVPDPYYGGPEGFEQVYHILRRCGRQLLASLISAG
jgi:protein-tyrosine phosphatase